MHEPPGPIDEDISAVLNFLYGKRGMRDRRGLPYSSLDAEEKRFLRDLLTPIIKFSEDAAEFATTEAGRAEKIVQSVVEALPLYTYAFPRIRGAKWLLNTVLGRLQFARPRPKRDKNANASEKRDTSKNIWISPSGKLFVDLRRRLKQWGDENANTPSQTKRRSSFGSKGRPQTCLAHSGPLIKFKSEMILCRFGCDANLLRTTLKFHDVLVKRILALDEQQTLNKDKSADCRSKIASNVKST